MKCYNFRPDSHALFSDEYRLPLSSPCPFQGPLCSALSSSLSFRSLSPRVFQSYTRPSHETRPELIQILERSVLRRASHSFGIDTPTDSVVLKPDGFSRHNRGLRSRNRRRRRRKGWRVLDTSPKLSKTGDSPRVSEPATK